MFDVVHERSDRLTVSSRIGGDIYQCLPIEEIEQVAVMIDPPTEGRGGTGVTHMLKR
jgi:hypothetical protein